MGEYFYASKDIALMALDTRYVTALIVGKGMLNKKGALRPLSIVFLLINKVIEFFASNFFDLSE